MLSDGIQNREMESSKDLSEIGLVISLLNELLPTIQVQKDPFRVFELSLDFLKEQLDLKAGIWLGIDSAGGFYVRYAYGFPCQELKGSPWDPDEGVKARLVRHEVLVLDSPQDEPLLGKAKSKGILVLSPLVAVGDLKGVMMTLHGHGAKKEILERSMRWVSAVLAPMFFASSLWDELSVDEILEKKVERVLANFSLNRGNLLKEITEIVERRLIACVMKKVGNVQSRAAQILGINRNTLRKKLEDYEITL